MGWDRGLLISVSPADTDKGVERGVRGIFLFMLRSFRHADSFSTSRLTVSCSKKKIRSAPWP